jgi:hypothetical protein
MTDLLACCRPRTIVGPSGPRLRHTCQLNRPLVRDYEWLSMQQALDVYAVHPSTCPCNVCTYIDAHADDVVDGVG